MPTGRSRSGRWGEWSSPPATKAIADGGEPIVLAPEAATDLRIVAELVAVLG